MNFKVEIYSNNDCADSPEELANVLMEVAASVRKMSVIPREWNPRFFTSVPAKGLTRATYKVFPVDIPMGLDP